MFLNAGRVIVILLEVLLLFNLLIVVHEIGHFLAARWRGLYIEKFGVWFGKPLWKKTINGVQYSLGSLPFGGFVALPQLAPMDMIEGKADMDRAKLPPISALDKVIVAFAGPLFSFLLALAFAAIVYVVGYPVGESDQTTVIGYVEKDSPAAKAGLLAGDRILQVDGKPVQRFSGMNDSVTWNVLRSEGLTIPFEVERNGTTKHFEVAPYKAEGRGWQRKGVRQVQIAGAQTAIIEKVQPDTPASEAGLRPGDVVSAFNGIPMFNPMALSDFMETNGTKPVTVQVAREGKSFPVTLSPRILGQEKTPRLGIQWDNSGRVAMSHPSPIEQVYKSITGTINTIAAVASPKSDVKLQHMSGPIGIWHLLYRLFAAEHGWQLALWFSVILNVNLAMLNLLPLPVLDGGHIVLAMIEAVRRRPVNGRVLEIVQTACAILIIGYMLYITFFDVQDLPWFRSKLEKYEPPSKATRE